MAGLQYYGGTNDPSLPAPITVTGTWFGATGALIYADVLRLVQQIIAQGNGLLDAESTYTMGISPGNTINFNNTNEFNVNVFTQIKTNFPNLKIVTVPEFAINGGGGAGGTEFVQLIADSVEGQRTVEGAFTEKMRAHAIVTKTSSWEQKKSQGTWGVIVYQPFAIAAMTGASVRRTFRESRLPRCVRVRGGFCIFSSSLRTLKPARRFNPYCRARCGAFECAGNHSRPFRLAQFRLGPREQHPPCRR